MINRNDTIAPSRLGNGSPPGNDERFLNEHRGGPGDRGDGSALPSNHMNPEPVEAIVSDVEEFARGWIGRIRRLIHRSSQLIERESLLAGAIARLDHQKAEWNKRTAAKEESLRNQSKRLTEAWLEVEAERRKAIQGARAAATAANKPTTGPVVAAPIAPTPGGQPASQPVVATNLPVGTAPAAAAPQQQVVTQPLVGQPQMPAAPPAVNVPVGTPNVPVQNMSVAGTAPAAAQVAPVSNTPISTDGMASTNQDPSQDDAFEQAEAATRQKIEEFKRMQRAIRSNRNN